MIDLEKAKETFLKEISQYDLSDEHIKRKELHSLRVMENSKKIAQRLNLTEEQTELATLIGLLHDVGRFEQYTIYHTYSDKQSVDHGELGVKLLKENNRIRKYIQTEEYDKILFKAIRNHGKYEIEDGLTEEELFHTKLIRDADKLDILYEGCEIFWKQDIEKINQTTLSNEVLKPIQEKKTILRTAERGFQKIDSVVELMALIYDLNFPESFAILKEEEYLHRIANRFYLQDEQARKDFAWVCNELDQYIETKLKK